MVKKSIDKTTEQESRQPGTNKQPVKKSQTPDSQPSWMQEAKTKADQTIKFERNSFPVGIGASVGGLEASSEFFSQLPSNTGTAFVLVQYLDPNHVYVILPKTELEGRNIEFNQLTKNGQMLEVSRCRAALIDDYGQPYAVATTARLLKGVNLPNEGV